MSLGRSVGQVCSISTHLGLLCLSSALPCPYIPPLYFRKVFVCGDWSTFPECFGALSSGRTTPRSATKFHEKDLSHTQLRVSAPLNSPLRFQVARSALRRLSLPIFSPFPLLALLLSLVLLCVVFFTRSPLPTPARLRLNLRLCSPPRGLLSLSSVAVAVVSPSAREVASGTAVAALLLRLLGEGALLC